MAIGDDFSIAVNGDIRYTGTTPNYTVIEFHRWLGDLMDDAQASGDNLLDITDATASARSTDNLITLNAPYNIDDTAARHLYDGSIVQTNGDEIYDGILVFAPAGTPLQIIQNGKALSPNFWDTGLNALASSGISHRFLVKTRTAAADIDGRRLLGQTRQIGFTYSEFPIGAGTARGNNVVALTYAADLNNETAIATIAGWNTVVNLTEGYQLLDVNNDTTDEPYYSQWDYGSQVVNDFFERHKWLARESTLEDSSADTGTDFQLGNATITGQAQSWTATGFEHFITRVRMKLKKLGAPTGNITCHIKAHSGAFGSASIPTGASLAAATVLDSTLLTTAYVEYEFQFLTPFPTVASTNYTVTLEKAVGDGSNHVLVEGLAASGTHAGNRSQEVSAVWTPTAADDIDFEVYGSPDLYGIPGEEFRGPTLDITVDTPTGTLVEPENITWTEASVSSSGILLATDSTTAATKVWIQLLTGIAPTDGTVLTGAGAGTVTVNVTVTPRTVSAPPVGASTGSAIVGAYGLGIQLADLTASDKLTDLDGTLRIPPNNVTFTVNGPKVSEDRLLVAPLGFEFAWDNEGGTPPFQLGETLTFTSPAGTAYLSELRDDGTTGRMICRLLTGVNPTNNSTISGGTSGATADVNGAVQAAPDVRQLKLATTLVSPTETAVVSVDAIPTDTPSSGFIRIKLNTGIERIQAYTSYTGSTFTIASSDYSGANTATGGAGEAGNSMYIAYIDKMTASDPETFTVVFIGNRNLFIRARDGGTAGDALSIKTFETSGQITTAGGSTTIIRTSDE